MRGKCLQIDVRVAWFLNNSSLADKLERFELLFLTIELDPIVQTGPFHVMLLLQIQQGQIQE